MARRPRDLVAQANEAARRALAASATVDPGDTLGALAWWDSADAWRMPAVDVICAFEAEKIEAAAVLPASPDWIVSFGRAVESVKASIRSRDLTLIDAAEGPNKERRVAIVRIARNGRVQTTDEGTITCPRDGSAAYVEREDSDGIARLVLDKASAGVGVYTSSDIRAAVACVFDRWQVKPCRVRAPHVVYWTPPGALDAVRQIRAAVEAIGWGEIELFVGSRKNPESVRAVTNTVNKGLEERLAEFAASAETYANATSKTRASTIESQIEEACRIRQEAELYRAILGAAVVSIDDRVAAVEKSLRSTLGLVEARA